MERKQEIDNIINKLMGGEGWLSYSSLSNFKSSPKDFIDYKLKAKVETPAMIYGSMVHCLVLEPELFKSRYHALDDTDICNQIGGAKPRATKAYKEWYAVAEQEAGDRIVVETDDLKAARYVANHVLYNRASRKVLDLCELREQDLEWSYKNFNFKGRMDGKGEKAVFDLKTCPDAEQGKFQRDIISNGYYLQAAMYLYGLNEVLPYYIIAADKVGGVSVHLLDQSLIEFGMKEYEFVTDKFNECILKDSFNQSYDFWSKRYDGIFIAEKSTRMY
jgi:PDDEXK-like domain of unknown function (DUF3799)